MCDIANIDVGLTWRDAVTLPIYAQNRQCRKALVGTTIRHGSSRDRTVHQRHPDRRPRPKVAEISSSTI